NVPPPLRELDFLVASGEAAQLQMGVDVHEARHQHAVYKLQRLNAGRRGDVGMWSDRRYTTIIPNQNGAIRYRWRRHGEDLSGADAHAAGPVRRGRAQAARNW